MSTYPTKQDREEFRLFCQQATDRQLPNIYNKEHGAADDGDNGREIYAEIALAEMEKRGISL